MPFIAKLIVFPWIVMLARGKPFMFCLGTLMAPIHSPFSFFARSISTPRSPPGVWIEPVQWPEASAAGCAGAGGGKRSNTNTTGAIGIANLREFWLLMYLSIAGLRTRRIRPLPQKLQRQLNVPRVARGAADSPELRRGNPRAGEAELGMVEEVEELGAELELALLVERESFEQREIPVVDAGTGHDVASGGAPAEARGWHEGIGAEPVVDRTIRSIVGFADGVRTRRAIADVRKIARLRYRTRCAGPPGVDAVDLPASEDGIPRARDAAEVSPAPPKGQIV